MIYLLTTIWLSPGGRSTVHIYTQTIHRTIQNKQYIEQHNNLSGRVRAVPRLGLLYPGICLTTEEKAWKNLSQGISEGTDTEHIKYRMSMLLRLFHVNFIAYDTCIRREFEVHFLPSLQVILLYTSIRVPKCPVFLPDLDFLTDRTTILGDTIKRTVLI